MQRANCTHIDTQRRARKLGAPLARDIFFMFPFSSVLPFPVKGSVREAFLASSCVGLKSGWAERTLTIGLLAPDSQPNCKYLLCELTFWTHCRTGSSHFAAASCISRHVSSIHDCSPSSYQHFWVSISNMLFPDMLSLEFCYNKTPRNKGKLRFRVKMLKSNCSPLAVNWYATVTTAADKINHALKSLQ